MKLTQYVIQLYFSKISYKQILSFANVMKVFPNNMHSGSHPIWSSHREWEVKVCGPSPWRPGSLSTVSCTAQPSHPQEPLWLTHKLPHIPGLESMSPMDTTITRPWQSCHDHQGSWWQTMPSPASFSEYLCDFIFHSISYSRVFIFQSICGICVISYSI